MIGPGCGTLIFWVCKTFLGDVLFIITVKSGFEMDKIGAIIVFWTCLSNLVRRMFNAFPRYGYLMTVFYFLANTAIIVYSTKLEDWACNVTALIFGTLFQLLSIYGDIETKHRYTASLSPVHSAREQRSSTVVPILYQNREDASQISLNIQPHIENIITTKVEFLSFAHMCDSCSCECSICFEPLLDKLTIMLKCQHTFHTECILKWFRSNSNLLCPLCRNSQR